MKAKEFLNKNHKNVCKESIEWLKDRTPKQAWDECDRGDWMLWIAKKQDVDLKILTLAKVRCASLVKNLMKDNRSLKALEVAERFALGDATREELDAAAAAGYAAAGYAAAGYAAAYDDAAYAAYAAAYDDAYDAAAAAYAGYAADAAAAAAGYAAAGKQARSNILSLAADICRETIPYEMLGIKALLGGEI